jgi:hypothetical protein
MSELLKPHVTIYPSLSKDTDGGAGFGARQSDRLILRGKRKDTETTTFLTQGTTSLRFRLNYSVRFPLVKKNRIFLSCS